MFGFLFGKKKKKKTSVKPKPLRQKNKQAEALPSLYKTTSDLERLKEQVKLASADDPKRAAQVLANWINQNTKKVRSPKKR